MLFVTEKQESLVWKLRYVSRLAYVNDATYVTYVTH